MMPRPLDPSDVGAEIATSVPAPNAAAFSTIS